MQKLGEYYKPEDIFYAHIGGMDSFAKGLMVAQKMIEDGILEEFISNRYESYHKGIGKKISERNVDLKSLEEYARGLETIENSSGMQEYLECLLNEYIMSVYEKFIKKIIVFIFRKVIYELSCRFRCRNNINNKSGKLIASATKEYPLETPKPGWAQQDPDHWWDASVYTIKEVLAKSRVDPKKISAIGLTGQMHGSVFLDREGKIIKPAILWCDQRTSSQCDKIYDIFGGEEEFIKLSYNKALTGFTAPKILWLAEIEPDNYKKLSQILLPKDYIRYKLSGTYATEVSDASGTVLLDIKKRNWSDKILSGLSIDKSLLPVVYESAPISSYVSKEASKLTGIIQGAPIVGGAGDQASGAVGSGIVYEGRISDYLGTSGVIFAHSDNPVYDPKGRLHSFCHAVEGAWHLMGVTLAAAGSYKWYYDTFGISDEIISKYKGLSGYELLHKQAEKSPPGADGSCSCPTYLVRELRIRILMREEYFLDYPIFMDKITLYR